YRRAKPKAAPGGLRLLEAVVDPSHPQEQTSENVLMVHLPGQVRIKLSSLAQVPLVPDMPSCLCRDGCGWCAGRVSLAFRFGTVSNSVSKGVIMQYVQV